MITSRPAKPAPRNQHDSNRATQASAARVIGSPATSESGVPR
jgi:hypothetical protein